MDFLKKNSLVVGLAAVGVGGALAYMFLPAFKNQTQTETDTSAAAVESPPPTEEELVQLGIKVPPNMDSPTSRDRATEPTLPGTSVPGSVALSIAVPSAEPSCTQYSYPQ